MDIDHDNMASVSPNLLHHTSALNQSQIGENKKKSETSLENRLEAASGHHSPQAAGREIETPSHSRFGTPFMGPANRTRLLDTPQIDGHRTNLHVSQRKLDLSIADLHPEHQSGLEALQRLVSRKLYQVWTHLFGYEPEEARKYFAAARVKIRTVNLMSSPKAAARGG